MAPRRALARRTKRLIGYWRSETRTIRQGLVALVLSTAAGFVAGLTLAHLTGTLASLPGLLILIPAAVGMKGTIFGAIGARLGTANAAGLLTLDLRPGGVLRRNVQVAILTTFSSSLWLAVLARAAGAISGQVSISIWDLLTISVIGGALGSALILAITIALSAASTRLGWDLDSVSTPMVTALGDMTTLPCLFLASLLVHNEHVAAVSAAIATVAALVFTVRSYTVRDPFVRRIIIEMTGTILLTPILDVMAGTLLRANEVRLALGARPARRDPTVRLAGRRARRHLLVADLLEAAARCDHAPRPARDARDRRRVDRRRAVGGDVHADRARRVGRSATPPASPGCRALARWSAACCSRASW